MKGRHLSAPAALALAFAVVACDGVLGITDVTVADGTATDASADALHHDDAAKSDGATHDGGVARDGSVGTDASTDAGGDDAAADAGHDAGCTVIPGLVAWWRGENDANDELGNSNGTWSGGSAYVAGASGQAFSLNQGGGSFVTIPDAPGLELQVPFSISAWVNLPVANASLRMVDKLTNGVNDGYLLDVANNSQPRFIGGPSYMQSPGSLTPNTWHHVAAVFESLTSRWIYVDGAPSVQMTAAVATGPSKPAVPLHFGANTDGTATYPGALDEVALYNRALTAAEVKSIYDRGSLSLCH